MGADSHVATGKCLNVQGGSRADTAPVIQWTCGGAGGNDEWKGEYLFTRTNTKTHVAFDVYRLKARHSLKCLDVVGADSADGARLQQYTCLAGAANQQETWF